MSADNRVAYVPFWHDTFLFAVDVASGERRQLTSHTQDNYGARFSPDGRSVAYHSTRTGNSEIWLHHLDGRPETQITDNDSWDLYPDWSPDGRAADLRLRPRGFPLQDLHRQQRRRRRAAVGRSADQLGQPVASRQWQTWSAAGLRMANRSRFSSEDETATALWTVQADGKGARKVLDNATGFDWYRDSRPGSTRATTGARARSIAVDLETGQERSLFVGAFHRDGRRTRRQRGGVLFRPGPHGHGARRVEARATVGARRSAARGRRTASTWSETEGTWHVHNGGWSADSKQLVYTQDKDYGDIYELVERR